MRETVNRLPAHVRVFRRPAYGKWIEKFDFYNGQEHHAGTPHH